VATVVSVRPETRTAKTFRLRLPRSQSFLAGQHYIVRLTAPDGYTASRSYSVASAPDGSSEIELTVERLPDGEVSMFLHDELRPGDEIEVRGPIGGWFVWRGDTPALLIGGGSGLVPLMAMLRLARRKGISDLIRLLVSVRSPDDLYYADELPGPETKLLYTRRSPAGEDRPAGRITPADVGTIGDQSDVYICGSESFSEAAADLVMSIGVPAERLRIEKFGPS
jgi:ferredoxin-NADP reductase